MNKLAILIPYYKIDFFEETLQSISKQTDKRFTLYVGNDASPDNPIELIKKYFNEENYHYYDYKNNLGGENLALQWERILENVTEDWFQILGDDDMIANNFVEEFYRHIDEIEKNNIKIIKISQAFINEKSKRYTEFSSYPIVSSTQEFIESKFFLTGRSSLSEHIFNLNKYKKNYFKKYPLAWHTDDMAVINFSITKGIYFIGTTNVLVRISEKSISGNISSTKNNILKQKASFIFFAELLNNYRKYISKKNISNLLKSHLARTWKLKEKNNVNLFSIYLYTNKPIKILTIPYKIYIINKNSKTKD